MTEDSLHTRVGTATLVLLGLAVALTLTFQGRHLRPGIVVHVELGRIGALTQGGKVRVAGRDVGSIDRVRLLPLAHKPVDDDPTRERARIVLDVWIDARYQGWVRERSEWFQNQPSVLGEAYLEIGPPRDGADAGAPLRDGASVRGIDPPRIDDLLQKSYENLRNMSTLIREGLPEARAFGRELDAISQELDAILEPTAVDALLDGRRRLWKEAILGWEAWQTSGATPAAARGSYGRARAAFERARTQIRALRLKLDALLQETDRLRAALGPERFERFERVTRQADALLTRAEAILDNAQAVMAMVERGEGTIGAFLADTELADEFKAMSKVIKQTPWETIGHPQDAKRP